MHIKQEEKKIYRKNKMNEKEKEESTCLQQTNIAGSKKRAERVCLSFFRFEHNMCNI